MTSAVMGLHPWASAKLIVGTWIAIVTFGIFRSIFCLFQSLSWMLFGIQNVIDKNKNGTKPVAQAMKVLTWCKPDPLIPTTLRDFICVHDEYLENEYVLQHDEVTLIFFDPHQDVAVFAEGQPGQLLWHSDSDPFLSISACKHARRLILMPVVEFNKLCATLPDPKGALVCLGHTGRCGSTLLTQIFESTNEAVCYSEPCTLHNLSDRYTYGENVQEVRQLMRSVIRMYTRPLKCLPNPKVFLMKPHPGPDFSICKLFKEVYPETKVFYMYRSMEKLSQSIYKVSWAISLTRLVYIISRFSGNLLEKYYKLAGYPSDEANRILDNDYCCGVFQAISASKVYIQMLQEDPSIRGVLFDDLIEHKEAGVRSIFKICGLPESLVKKGMEAFARDSQRGTFIAKKTLSNFPQLTYTMEDKVKADALLREFGFPTNDKSCRLDGTLDFGKVEET
jgi:hypothetical protein